MKHNKINLAFNYIKEFETYIIDIFNDKNILNTIENSLNNNVDDNKLYFIYKDITKLLNGKYNIIKENTVNFVHMHILNSISYFIKAITSNNIDNMSYRISKSISNSIKAIGYKNGSISICQ